MLYLLNVGCKGELLPLGFSPQPGSMPIVCEVPPLLPSEPYLVAYYTARAADPALYHHWNRACCRLSARPEDAGRCPGP